MSVVPTSRLHGVKLIVDLIYEGGLSTEIQDGSYARTMIAEFDGERPNFLKKRSEEQNLPIERAGKELRKLMSWVDEDG